MESASSFSLLASLSLLVSLSLFFVKHFILSNHSKKPSRRNSLLPPTASFLPVFTHIFFHRRSVLEIAGILRRFHSLHGPIFSLRLSPFSHPSVFISDASLCHSALIHHSATLADRPPSVEPVRFLGANNCNISTAPYGSLWRILRRNLSVETLHPSRILLFAPARRWALCGLLDYLHCQSGCTVAVREVFQQAIFSLLLFMCFGKKLGEKEIREIESTHLFLLSIFTSFNVFSVIPTVTKVLFRKRWEEIVAARRKQAEIFLPMTRERQDRKLCSEGKKKGFEYCYVDSLLDIKHPENGGRGLTDDEIVNLCHEFLIAGVDTTTTELEWIMAELVQNQSIQSKLLLEIESLIGSRGEENIKEDDLQRMPYLKAMIMESLRRHPPAYFGLPHSVTEDITIENFLLPKGSKVRFSVADVNWDKKNWEEPMLFRPERFMVGIDCEDEMDLTGSKEIKMMTFGAGRRMCPGYVLAILHLELFVANLVKEFLWMSETGLEVDLSEKLELTTIMKNPLRAKIIPRRKK